MLFGDEFDADERAEVGGGLRSVEGVSTNLSAISFLDWLCAGEDEFAEVLPAIDSHTNYGYLISINHGLMMI
jgi:hypothetical protein